MVTPLFLLITASTFAYFVAVGALIPILPRYAKGPLGGGDVSVGLAIGAFALAAVVLRPFAGRLGDRRGRRILIVGGAGIVAVSTAGYLAADSLPLLIGLRILSGAGEAGFYVGAATVINDLAPDERRGEALSFFSLALFSGIAVGPLLGETLLQGISFGAVWIASASSAVIAAVLGLRVGETRPDEAAEAKPPPLVHPAGLLPGAVLGTIICGLAGVDSFVPLYALEIGFEGSGVIFFIFSAIIIAVRSLGATLPDRIGRHRIARIGLVATAAGLGTIALWATPAGLYLGTAIFAFGHSLTFPALMSLAVMAAPPSERGAVIGTFTAFFDLAFGAGAIGLGAVAEVAGYRATFATASAIALGGLLLLLFYGRRSAAAAERAAREDDDEAEVEPLPSSSV